MGESTQDLRPLTARNCRFRYLLNNQFIQDNQQLVQMVLCCNNSLLNKVVFNSQVFRFSIIKQMKICPPTHRCNIPFLVKSWDLKYPRFSKIAIMYRKILSNVIIIALWTKICRGRRHKLMVDHNNGVKITRSISDCSSKTNNPRHSTAILAAIWFRKANTRTRSDNNNNSLDAILLLAGTTSRLATNPQLMRRLSIAKVRMRTRIRLSTQEVMAASIEVGQQLP